MRCWRTGSASVLGSGAPSASTATHDEPSTAHLRRDRDVRRRARRRRNLLRHPGYRAARRSAAGETVNAVLLLHGTGGTSTSWLTPSLADELVAPGAPLDAEKFYVIIPDGIGRGGSSKPSDGLRMKFPHYRYADMVTATHRLLTEHLGIAHLRLVLGTSMGGMQTWMWGEMYPDLMDGLVPIASQPIGISGR